MTLRTVELAEATLAVRGWGDPDGRSLLSLHSLGPAASAASLGLAAAPLVERGFRLVAPDQPGFGRSPALPAERFRPSFPSAEIAAVRGRRTRS
jgi:magnesium chelatase accessory protein